MPETNNTRRPTLAELIELHRVIPPADANAARRSLADRFLIPPFSVLDARQGYWQKRKKMWIELGIQSELGRGENLQPPSAEDLGAGLNNYRAAKNGLLGISEQARSHYRTNATPGGTLLPATSLKDGKTQRGDGKGRPLATTFGSGGPGDLASGFKDKSDTRAIKTQGWVKDKIEEGDISGGMAGAQSGTSIFDPVLCELAYRWFCPTGGSVLDPFAGGSVRGIVAAKLGRSYAGVDLRPEQAEANYAQAEVLCMNCEGDLRWVVGDAADINELLPGSYDFVFSCPPYADLERYSDDPRDLSTMEYGSFLRKYRHIITTACGMLKQDRFACFVVGDVRDRDTGNYRNFVADTIAAFRDAGMELYNEAVLVTAVGSLPIRVGKQFAGYRKLGKTHQNVLVFVKGDAARAAVACGEVDVDDLDMPAVEVGAVAICAQDTAQLASQGYVDGDGAEVTILRMPLVDACLLCDILRGEARAAGIPAPRVWVGTADGWKRATNDDNADMAYLVGNTPYLNRYIFPDATVPTAVPLAPRKMR